MESNNELKEMAIGNTTCYYFDDITEFEDFHFGNILLDEKLYKNTLAYVTSNKTLIDAKTITY